MACELPHEGRWNLESSELGSRTFRASLSVDRDSCTFAFAEWDPTPEDDEIDGGQIESKRVFLSGDAFWSTCGGSLTMEGAMMSGECDDGTTFHFMHDPAGQSAGHH
jgi:hypothetical protein